MKIKELEKVMEKISESELFVLADYQEFKYFWSEKNEYILTQKEKFQKLHREIKTLNKLVGKAMKCIDGK